MALVLLCASVPALAGIPQSPVPIPAVAPAGEKRSIELLDTLEMRDATALSVSPDGTRVAFRVRKRDNAANTERAAWYVADTNASGRLVYLGDAGEPNWEFITDAPHQRLLVTPAAWSPDGSKVAYVAYRSGEAQLWLANANGSGFKPLTHDPADVGAFAWERTSGRVIYMTGLTRAARDAAIRDKQLHGVRVQNGTPPPSQLSGNAAKAMNQTWQSRRDDYMPLLAQRWDHTRYLPQAAEFWSIDPRSRKERKATDAEKASLAAVPVAGFDLKPTDTLAAAAPDGGSVVFTRNVPGGVSDFVRNDEILVREKGGEERRLCDAEPCTGRVLKLTWSKDGTEVYFQRSEGLHFGTIGFYAVAKKTGTVRTVLKTTEALMGDSTWFRGPCAFTGDRAICVHEAPTVPTEVVALSMRDGAMTTLAELNPEFRNIELQAAEKIDWDVDKNERAYGWLVKPKGYEPGRKYPLMLIPNRQRAFLRGGDGEEYPIQLLAQKGFVVFAYMYNSLVAYPAGEQKRDPYQLRKLGYEVYQRTVESAIDMLAERGLIESNCVGLTGMSDTADKGNYVVTHSQRIAAASISGGAIDPMAFMLEDQQLQAWLTGVGLGYPDPQGPYWKNWLELSPALNAKKVRAPLLLHAPDAEILLSVSLFRALIELGKPVELFNYWEEPHFKVQPRHLAEINERNVDWFSFWLRGVEDPAPAKQDQYERWRTLRKQVPELGCPVAKP